MISSGKCFHLPIRSLKMDIDKQSRVVKEDKKGELTILIVGKQSIFRQGLRQALSSYKEIEVVGDFDLTADALSPIENLLPDIVLIDSGVHLVIGLSLTRQIAVHYPEIAVVILASSLDDDQLLRAIKSGAVAFLSEDIVADKLADILRRVGRGEYPINDSLLERPNTARQVLQQFQSYSLKDIGDLIAPLSPREAEILKYIAEGNPNKRIAYALGIGEQTIKNHIASIMRKLHANDRTHAVVLAIRVGWLNVGEIPEPQ